MPVNTLLATKVWNLYLRSRDAGHSDFVRKAETCENFFAGDQWQQEDLAKLRETKRPALTINKILSTVANVMGEQVLNRAEISFRPKAGGSNEVADALAKVFKHISNTNQLDWKRSDLFADGIITSRGYLDVRMSFDESLQGDVIITPLNPKNVLPDPDAEDADPSTWNQVITTKWVTANDIEILYSKADAALLRDRGTSTFTDTVDSIDGTRDRFGDLINTRTARFFGEHDDTERNIRIIEVQQKRLDKQEFFVDLVTGETRPIPETWSPEKIQLAKESLGYEIIKKVAKRIRWTVIADDIVLHDDWSPYKSLTVVPYFPYFRRGTTIGLVQNLVSPQELLNKVSSQELHVVNTTANSGWKIKAGALVNMSVEELEQRGAETGLVVEVEDMNGIEKIQPNQVPQGLDRISFKAEEHIKGISGVGDSQQGQDRADVAAKAIQQKRAAGSTGFAKVFDSLTRSDFWLAQVLLELVQGFYTEPRTFMITNSKGGNKDEEVSVNQFSAEGVVVTDLTLGEYEVVISSVPQRETLEDSQFDQALSLRQLGVEIDDSVLIKSSRLLDKDDIISDIEERANSPESQKRSQLEMEQLAADVEKTKSEAAANVAKAGASASQGTLSEAKATKEGTPEDTARATLDAQVKNNLAVDKQEFDQNMEREKLKLEREKLSQAQVQKSAAQGVINATSRFDKIKKTRSGDEKTA